MAKTRAQSSTAPPDDAVGAGASVFTPLLPARITSTSHAALGEMGDLVVSIKNTFDGGLFRQCVPDIEHEMAEQLRMVLNESDVHKRVIQYFMLCHDIIDDHGWRIFFNAKEDEVVLHDLILEKALDIEKFYQNQRRAKRSREHPKVPPAPCPHSKRGEGSKREVARLKRLRKYLTLAEKTVTLNEVLELPYCVDTGTDRTAISRKHW
ncbi:uncharacterized protein PITG_21465 [Phytophthora infestans T30-4]|uniref:Uncharacterized protein n=1 Tax=Phytophthora infestans (strain T30-4) TaxID=403677 RepID=D0P3W5_PHYIT|nr:uncharacterized protein PITG_21465 [Phytophthora infestans T30-4]EEY62063.1 hypothetical protein PITG_21465 [Phytophthora infestans T30-4]|eukprot:XP_002895011.1 hypothetical protein PITG_21465 [Phytophthora infestans T30-4]